MKKTTLVAILVTLVAFGCKTQEDIRREKTLEVADQQTQKLSANTNLRFQALEEKISQLTGQMEEVQHSNEKSVQVEIKALKQKVADLQRDLEQQKALNDALAEKMNEQTQYIEQVVKELSRFSGKKTSSPAIDTVSDDVPKEDITVKNGISKYENKDFDTAKLIFQSLLDNKKTKKKDKEACLNYLGLIEYREKNYQNAKVFFSRIYTDNPQSKYAAASLLYLAKSFAQLNMAEEAKQTLEELESKFPKTKEAQEGEKVKAKL